MNKRPDYRLFVNGKDISPTVNGRLVSLSLNDKEGIESDTVDITLTDHDGAVELPPTGAELQVLIGWHGEPLVDKGTYHVDEIEHAGPHDLVVIRARSADFMGELPGKKSRSWRQATVGEIVQQIATEHGLTPVITDRLANLRRVETHQTDESDLNLLTRLGDYHDAIVTVKSGNLLFLPVGHSERVSTGQRLPGITLHRTDHFTHRYSRAQRHQYTGVRAKWTDFDGGIYDYVVAGTEERLTDLQGSFSNAEEAQYAADAELRQMRRNGTVFTLQLSQGNPELTTETPLTLRGWKPEIDQTEWFITEVTHTLDDNGLHSHITCHIAD